MNDPDLQEPPRSVPPGWAPGDGGPAAGPLLTFRPPVLTYALIAVNVAMWLIVGLLGQGQWLYQLWDPDVSTLVLLGGKVGPLIQGGQYWRLVTAMFLHAGIIHLAVNMWALWQLGMFCELLYGRARFLILYVCSGLIGNVASFLASQTLGVGASGALFGLFGVALVFSIKYRRELPRGMGDRMLRSLIPVLLVNLFITLGLPFIDKFAHLGGLLGGAFLALFTESRAASAARRERELLPVPLALVTSLGLLAYGAWGVAGALPLALKYHATARQPAQRAAVYRDLLAQDPEDPALMNQLAYFEADVLDAHLDEAERLARKAVQAMPNDGEIVDTLAWVYFKEGKLPDAEMTQKRAVRLDGNQADLRYHLGAIEAARGELAAARQEFETALRLDPKQADARRALAALPRRPAAGGALQPNGGG